MIADSCNKCGICKYTKKKCDHKGSDSPYLYFIGEAPGPEEAEVGIPFVGRAGKYLNKILDEFGINTNNSRYWNTILCYPQVSDEDKKFRAPLPEEIENCKHFVIEDIISTKPKVVVTLGASSSRTLIGEAFTTISRVRGHKFICKLSDSEDSTFIVLPTYHPSYLMRNKDNIKIHSEFKNDIKLALKLAEDSNYNPDQDSSVIDDNEYNNQAIGSRDNKSVTIEVKTYKEFDEFCKEYLDKYDMIGFDVETNAKEVHSEAHRVVGFSLAASKDIGCYVILDSLDYTMSDIDKRLIEKRLRKLLVSKKVMVYNSQHELPVTLNWLDIDFSMNMDDLFIKVKLMNSDSVSFY